MAKRLINKSRIKRLSTFPWIPGVETKDLRKANPEELNQAVLACSTLDISSMSSKDRELTIEQQEMLLTQLIEAHDEPSVKLMEELVVEPEPSTGTRSFVHSYMAEPEWVEVVYPGLARDEQAAEIEKDDLDVLACVWTEYDGYFVIDAMMIKKFPFKVVLVSGTPEENIEFDALFDDDQI